MRIGGVLFLLAISVASVRAASPEAIKEVAASWSAYAATALANRWPRVCVGLPAQQREDIGSY